MGCADGAAIEYRAVAAVRIVHASQPRLHRARGRWCTLASRAGICGLEIQPMFRACTMRWPKPRKTAAGIGNAASSRGPARSRLWYLHEPGGCRCARCADRKSVDSAEQTIACPYRSAIRFTEVDDAVSEPADQQATDHGQEGAGSTSIGSGGGKADIAGR